MADEQHEALGLIETRGLVAAIEAADAMLKASNVRLLGIEKTEAALMTVQVVGETAAVQASVDAGRAAAERVGVVFSSHVIARPAAEVAQMQALSDVPPASSVTRSTGKKSVLGGVHRGYDGQRIEGLCQRTSRFADQGSRNSAG